MWGNGVPGGLQSDPNSGKTGNQVLGYNLGGAYPSQMAEIEWATSPAFNTVGFSNLTLDYWSFSRFAAGAQAFIQS